MPSHRTKRWHRGRPTHLVRGRVYCEAEDRHRQVAAVALYARRVAAAPGMSAGSVGPLFVVHGSPIVGGRLEWDGTEHVVGPDLMVPTLAAAPRVRDP